MQVKGISKDPEIVWTLEFDWHLSIFLGRVSMTFNRFSKESLNLKRFRAITRSLQVIPFFGQGVDSEACKRDTRHNFT